MADISPHAPKTGFPHYQKKTGNYKINTSWLGKDQEFEEEKNIQKLGKIFFVSNK